MSLVWHWTPIERREITRIGYKIGCFGLPKSVKGWYFESTMSGPEVSEHDKPWKKYFAGSVILFQSAFDKLFQLGQFAGWLLDGGRYG